MTSAPSNLLAVRRLLLDQLGPHGLASDAVGIVGDPAHRGGYHCGTDRVVTDDYSVVESSRDRTGLTDYASALDVGSFALGSQNLRTFSTWCVAQCVAGAPDTLDLREIIYSPDGTTVRRWDRLGKRTTGDSSHRWHTHFSYHRDATKAGRDLTPLFRRYLTTIGLIEGNDMSAEAEQQIAAIHAQVVDGRGADADYALVVGNTATTWVGKTLAAHGVQLAALRADVAALAGRDVTDEPAIVAGVLAGLDPTAIAAAIPADLAQRVADELAARLAS